jgi:hypothetical protein
MTAILHFPTKIQIENFLSKDLGTSDSYLIEKKVNDIVASFFSNKEITEAELEGQVKAKLIEINNKSNLMPLFALVTVIMNYTRVLKECAHRVPIV